MLEATRWLKKNGYPAADYNDRLAGGVNSYKWYAEDAKARFNVFTMAYEMQLAGFTVLQARQDGYTRIHVVTS